MYRAFTVLILIASTGSAAAGGAVEGIDWWKGDVAAAFAHAKEHDKPLFLYWGAVWCPPCNQIKKTIFTRHEFQEKMKAFLPIYLDGDTDRAQIWGEKLGSKGYPTMMVFNPQGEEVMRLPGGLQAEQFNQLLDESLEQMKPLRTVLDEALAASSGDAVKDGVYRLIAYYSWGQDSSVNLSDVEREDAFRRLESKIPARLTREKSRLYALWLDAALTLAADDEAERPLSAEELTAADGRVREILGSRDLFLANLDLGLYSAGKVVKALHPSPGPERTRLIEAWERAASSIENDPSLSVDERLSAVIPGLEFLQLERGDKPLPASFREHVAERVKWAETKSTDAYTRQSAMSTAGWLLRQVGLDAEARALYTDQLSKAVSPHYFMSSLATLAKQDGKTEEAVDWMRKAWETAEGPATRFQWGTSYLLGLIDLVPKDGKRIQAESLRVLTELLKNQDAFAGRNNARIKRLAKEYTKWNAAAAHKRELTAIREAMVPSCQELTATDGDDSLRARCVEFFSELGKQPTS